MTGHRSRPAALAEAVRALGAGRPEAALAPLRRAAEADPASFAVQHDLGLACLEAGRPQEAVDALRRATALAPDHADAHHHLGLALERTGAAAEAVRAFDRTTALRPGHAEAWLHAGSLVLALGHRDEAIGCFRRAATAGRATPLGRLGAARALLAERRDAEAERELRRLLARDPDNAAANDLLGNLLADRGDPDEARSRFALAVAADPLMAGAWYDLVRCRRLAPAEAPLVPVMQAALATPGLPPEPRIRLHLALGRAHDDLGDPAAAMDAFRAADALRTSLQPFDADEFSRRIAQLIALPPPRPPARAVPGTPAPILILGLPRSGTTLLEQIVSAHPAVVPAGELPFWGQVGTPWLEANLAGRPVPDPADHARAYLALLSRIAPGAAHVTDKMPFNVLWAGLIHAALPDAVMLHIRRAPIDVALSIHQTLFNPRLPFPTGGEPLVRYLQAHARLAAHWRRTLPAGTFVEIDYDALTADPEPAIRRILAACRLPWADACLHPERNANPVRTPSREQARRPINRDAIERWRRYEPWLGPLRALLDVQPG